MQQETAKRIERIIKKYKKVFDALEAYDLGRYKRSMVIKKARKRTDL